MDRLPPFDTDAEEVVIGAMMIDPNVVVDVLDILSPADFYREKNRWVFEAVQKLNDASICVNQITVAHELEQKGKLEEMGGTVFLSQAIGMVPTTVGISDTANIVKSCAVRRRLIIAAGEIVRLGYDTSESDVLSKASAIMDSVQNKAPQEGLTSLNVLAGHFFDNLDETDVEANFAPPKGLMTGFYDLDRILGGFRRGNLIILAARPSMGKTSLGLNIAQKVGGKGKTAAVFSLEMSKDELMQKLLGTETKVDISKMRNSWLSPAERQEIVYGLSRLSEYPIWIDDDPAISLPVIRNRAARLQSQHGLDLVIVDYLGLMSPTERKGNREQEVSALARGFKVLAKTLDVPVLLLSQLNRAVEGRTDKRPVLSDLRESGAIEQDADVVIFISRDDKNFTEEQWYKLHPTKQYPEGEAFVDVAKHRNGPTGNFTLLFKKETTTFENTLQGWVA